MAQKRPETLIEMDVNENVVTQNVTPNTENVTRSDLLKAIRGLSKEDLISLLTEVLLKD